MSHDKDSGISPMRIAALSLHEMYLELRHAGFKHWDAMYLIRGILSSNQPEDKD